MKKIFKLPYSFLTVGLILYVRKEAFNLDIHWIVSGLLYLMAALALLRLFYYVGIYRAKQKPIQHSELAAEAWAKGSPFIMGLFALLAFHSAFTAILMLFTPLIGAESIVFNIIGVLLFADALANIHSMVVVSKTTAKGALENGWFLTAD